MAGASQDDEEEITAINVTPLVDVMLVLLVIFMVTASYIVHRSIHVTLPDAATGQTTSQQKSLTFTLDKDSQLYLDGEAVTYGQLESLVEKVRSELPASGAASKLQALISADKVVPHGEVIRLIDHVRKLGISDFAVNVEASPVAP